MSKRKLSLDENIEPDNITMSRKRVAKPTTQVEEVCESEASYSESIYQRTLVDQLNTSGLNGSRSSMTPSNHPLLAGVQQPYVMLEKETMASLKRKSLVFSSSHLATPRVRDEEDERRRRTKHRLTSHKQNNVSSPRKSMATSPHVLMNPAQLKEHYSTCIKMAVTNKINVKNAFQFHILDYMSSLLRTNEINFNLATNTLDAGTKVYVSRVDAVHADAQKVAMNLLAADKNVKEGAKDGDDGEVDPNDVDAVDEDGNQVKTKKRKRKVGKKVTTAEQLDEAKLSTNPDIDPVLHRLNVNDISNVNNYFLATLKMNTHGELILNSRTIIDETTPLEPNDRDVPVAPFTALFKDLIESEHPAQICPKLAPFTFLNRDDGAGVEFDRLPTDESTHTRRSEFTFDLEAEIEEEPEANQGDIFDDLDMGGFDNNDDEENMSGEEQGDVGSVNRQSVIRAVNLESMPDLLKILADRPDDYTYFDKKIMGSWAGPQYWKPNGFLRMRAKLTEKANGDPAAPRTRQKKQYEPLDFGQMFDTKDFRIETKKRLNITLNTLERWKRFSELNLPSGCHYDIMSLLRAFIKTDKPYACLIRTKNTKRSADVDDDSDDGCGFDAPTSPGDLDGLECPDDFGFPESQPFSTQMFSTQPNTNAFGDAFTGDNLVDQPFMVEQIQLPFTKVAKKIDVKALKRAVLDMIMRSSSTSNRVSFISYFLSLFGSC